MTTPSKWIALSVRQPWAWAILYAGKDLENRDWKLPACHVGQRRILHASRCRSKHEYEAARAFIEARCELEVPELADLPLGIVGAWTFTGCVERSASPWFMGRFGFEIENPVTLATPVPCRGSLGFWHVPEDVAEEVRRAA